MAVVKCIWCQTETPDDSGMCVSCGMPLVNVNEVNKNIGNLNGKEFDMTEVLELVEKNQKLQAIKLTRELTGANLYDAKVFVENLYGANNLRVNADAFGEMVNSIPPCPACQSTQTVMLRKETRSLFGLKKKVSVSHVCQTCGHEFE